MVGAMLACCWLVVGAMLANYSWRNVGLLLVMRWLMVGCWLAQYWVMDMVGTLLGDSWRNVG